ncbi:hypothetical protein ILUMI_26446 [Ignelater luminosus]|uniref:Uncharacterized protein n=1 Tax=Ignelater luminosus TaxID=2038154 RepID=A0A8K0C4B6_IGNLU|nr:hypothetical protein ILUMI_26446 [Ignelater luminosus]
MAPRPAHDTARLPDVPYLPYLYCIRFGKINSVPSQSLPEEVVEESQKIIPSEVPQEPGSASTFLTELILTHLEKLGFELKWLRRQGYDNAANMKGVRKDKFSLEAIAINLSDCVRMLSETIQKVKGYRQSEYDQMKIAANEIAENLECSTEFPAETEVRARRKKRQFDYEEAVDEHSTEENKFKI